MDINNLTDKDLLDWLQSGHGVVALAPPNEHGLGNVRFCANFELQDWDEFDNVREAIKYAIKREHTEKKGQSL